MAQAPAGSGTGFPKYSGAYSGGYQMQNLLSVAEFLVSNGYSRTAAAGIAGTIAGESSGDPEAVGTGGAGLIGWTPPSKASPNYPIVTGTPQADFDAQLTDLLEYNNTNGPVDQLKKMSGDPVQAAQFYSQQFERPLVTNSDVRANVATSIYSRLGGYKADSAYTQYGGGGVNPNVGKGLKGSSAGLAQYVSSLWDSLFVGEGEVSKIEGAQLSNASDTALSIVGLTAPFVKIARDIDWFAQPNHWIRIFCGLAGAPLFLFGLWNLSHVGGSATTESFNGITVPLSAGGQMALPFGIFEVTFGAGLLFIAFHNLPTSVKTLPDFLAYIRNEIQGGLKNSVSSS